MQSIKLHEATKQFKISNKLAMFFLEKLNVPVKSHSSVISMEQLELLREFSNNQGKFKKIVDEFDGIEDAKKEIARKLKVEKKEKELEEERKEREKARLEKEKRERELYEQRERQRKEQAARAKVPEEKPNVPTVQAPNKSEFVKREQETRPPHKETPKHEEEPRAPQRDRDSRPVAPTSPQRGRDPRPVAPTSPQRGRDSRPVAPTSPQKGRDSRPVAPTPVKAEDNRKPHSDFKKNHVVPKPKVVEPAAKSDEADKRQKKFKERSDGFNRDPRKFQRGGGSDRFRHGSHYSGKHKSPVKPIQKKVVVLDLPKSIRVSDFITPRELSEQLNIKLKQLGDILEDMNLDCISNQIMEINDIKAICTKLNVEMEMVPYEDQEFFSSIERKKAVQESRAPVVTVMGHVDHGKTTLLDTLRKTSVADREAGGITQSIGAYKLSSGGHDIIFIDTPGHEAFTNLRARGARVTDIVVLVVAANDSVQPQTIEAINHARAANVPIIVAINKIDLQGADPTRVKQALSQHNVLVEEWGGDVVSVEISAKLNQNLDTLLEMIILVTEMLELKYYKNVLARGTIIESRLDTKLGPIATVLIMNGVARRGDFFICGNSVGKIKMVFDDKGDPVNEAQAPIPVEVMGFDEVPESGDLFQVVEDIEKAKRVIDIRKIRGKEAKEEEVLAGKKLSLQNLFKKLEHTQIKSFPLIVKTDNFGSSEVLEKVLLRLSKDKLEINIIHKGVGNITEGDIMLASTANAIIIGFNVRAPQKILAIAKQERIEIKLYNVIYHLMEDIEKALTGEIEPEYIETQIGKVEILQKFKISRVGMVAGCIVREGKVTKKSKVKVFRGKDLLFEGELESLKRVKDEVSEVRAGTECGIKVKNFNAIEVGDFLEVYELKILE